MSNRLDNAEAPKDAETYNLQLWGSHGMCCTGLAGNGKLHIKQMDLHSYASWP